MKYTINGFSQRAALGFVRTEERNGKTVTVRLDIIDLAILDWFRNFYPRMKKINDGDREWAWLKHSELANDMPLLNISSKSCIDRMQKLVKFGILDYKLVRKKGTYSYYSFGPRYMELVSDDCISLKAPNEKDCISSNERNIGSVQTDNKDPLTIFYPLTTSSDVSSAKASSTSKKDDVDYQSWKEAYDENASHLPKARLMSNKRKAAVRSMLKQGITLDDFTEACRKAESSSFLKGGGENGWRATPDWMFNGENVLKILEGKYDDRETKQEKYNNADEEYFAILDELGF